MRGIAALRKSLALGDTQAAAAAGIELSELVTDWRRKDFTEAEYIRGGKGLRTAQAAAEARRAKASDDSRAGEWFERVRRRPAGVKASRIYLRIAEEDDPVMDGAELVRAVERVKKAVQRYRRRSRNR